MSNPGKLLVLVGLAITALGVIVWLAGGRSGGWLPGDLAIRRPGFSFHFPIVTCLVVSILLTVIMRLWNR
jgi:hypothetical protein